VLLALRNHRAETARGIGERARDGQFEFVVSRVRCGIDRIDSQYLNKAAQGQFCLISVRVRNIGNEQRTFEQSSQYLFDTAGRRYETCAASASSSQSTPLPLRRRSRRYSRRFAFAPRYWVTRSDSSPARAALSPR
jgi:hypothetical protein